MWGLRNGSFSRSRARMPTSRNRTVLWPAVLSMMPLACYPYHLRSIAACLFFLEVVVDEEGGGPLRVGRVLGPLRPAQRAPRARAPPLGVHEADGVGAGEPVAVAQRPADQQKIYDPDGMEFSVLPGEINVQLATPFDLESEAGFGCGTDGRRGWRTMLNFKPSREDIRFPLVVGRPGGPV